MVWDYTKDSITVNMVVKTTSDKYRVAPDSGETSLSLIQKMISDGGFTAEFVPATFASDTSTGTLIITED